MNADHLGNMVLTLLRSESIEGYCHEGIVYFTISTLTMGYHTFGTYCLDFMSSIVSPIFFHLRTFPLSAVYLHLSIEYVVISEIASLQTLLL